jgi:hypothetical protein
MTRSRLGRRRCSTPACRRAPKLDLAGRIADTLESQGGRVPLIDPAFRPPPEDPEERAGFERLRIELQDQLDRAATHAFSRSFLIAAAFALAALLPLALARRREVSL